MLYACDQRFDVTKNLENFCELNKALMLHACVARFDVMENLKTFWFWGVN